MFELDSDDLKIVMTRGDSGSFSFSPKDEKGEAIDLSKCELIFSVKSSYDATDYAIQHKVQADGIVTIDHKDTQSLAAGKYVWDIEMTQPSGQVSTLGPGVLKINPDVTID